MISNKLAIYTFHHLVSSWEKAKFVWKNHLKETYTGVQMTILITTNNSTKNTTQIKTRSLQNFEK